MTTRVFSSLLLIGLIVPTSLWSYFTVFVQFQELFPIGEVFTLIVIVFLPLVTGLAWSQATHELRRIWFRCTLYMCVWCILIMLLMWLYGIPAAQEKLARFSDSTLAERKVSEDAIAGMNIGALILIVLNYVVLFLAGLTGLVCGIVSKVLFAKLNGSSSIS